MRLPLVVTLEDWWQFSDREKTLATALFAALGWELDTTFQYVVGERSAWRWRYELNEAGRPFAAGRHAADAAWTVDRVSLGVAE